MAIERKPLDPNRKVYNYPIQGTADDVLTRVLEKMKTNGAIWQPFESRRFRASSDGLVHKQVEQPHLHDPWTCGVQQQVSDVTVPFTEPLTCIACVAYYAVTFEEWDNVK